MKFYSLFSLLVLPMVLNSACRKDSHDKPAPADSPNSEPNPAPAQVEDKVLKELLDQLKASGCTTSVLKGVESCPDPSSVEEAESLFTNLQALKKHTKEKTDVRNEWYTAIWSVSIDKAITKLESSSFMVAKPN